MTVNYKSKLIFYSVLFLITASFLQITCCNPAYSKVTEKKAASRIQQLSSNFRKAYLSIDCLRAEFYQETWTPGIEKPVTAEGTVWIKRPNLMRWQYDKPYHQLIVAGLRDVFIYEPAQKQVMVIPRNRFLTSQITNAFFAGDQGLNHFFNVSLPENKKDRWSLILKPIHPEPQIKQIRITLDPNSWLIKEIWIDDNMGEHTHLVFKNIVKNPKINPDLFHFVPPKGVKVYNTPKD